MRLEDARYVVVKHARHSAQNGLLVAFPQISQHLTGRQVLNDQRQRQEVAEDISNMSAQQMLDTPDSMISNPTATAMYDNQSRTLEAKRAVDEAYRSDYGLSA